MQSRKKQEAAKGAAEAFGIAASVTSFIFDVVGALFKIPSLFKWIGSAVVGLIGACVGGRNAYNAAEEKERKEQEELQLMREERIRMIELMSRPQQVGHHHHKRRHSHHAVLSTGLIQSEVGLGHAAAVNQGPAEVKIPVLSPRNDRLFYAANDKPVLELAGVEDEKDVVYQRRCGG